LAKSAITVRIHIEGDMSLILENRISAALDAFAAILKIPRQVVVMYGAYEGSYVNLSGHEHKYADFGITVVGESMAGDGLFPGDIALIRRQPTVENGEIAAILINTPDIELGVLKRYFVYEKRAEVGHWLLKSSNPSSKHLLLIPQGVNENAVQKLYTNEMEGGLIGTFKDAEITIIGKYVGVIKKE
jgi:hypothetical protein